ncbi:MAG TPA: hypothetical protein VED37_06785 [Ktedonobacteraceae bacterium]|nr:hypothetical protein [Ktedonobacteraceae bacterium]
MRQFLPIRKAFLIAAFVFVLNYVLGTAVVLQLNLSDPNIGGPARNSWLVTGTQLGAPAWFMVIYVIMLLLATRQRWIGILGTLGITLLTLMSGLSWTADWGMVLRVIEHHLSVLTGLAVTVLIITTPTVVILGIATLIVQRRSQMRVAIS